MMYDQENKIQYGIEYLRERVRAYLGEKSIVNAFEDIYHHVGNAPEQNKKFLETVLYPAINR